MPDGHGVFAANENRAPVPRTFTPTPYLQLREMLGQRPAPALIWHHVIPWNTLWRAWNRAQAEATGSQANSVLLTKWIDLLAAGGRIGPGIDNKNGHLVRAMRAGTLNVVQQQYLSQRLCWMSFNLVEGPSDRANDPEDGLDLFTVGLRDKEPDRMRALREAYEMMQDYLNGESGRRLARQLDFLCFWRHATPIEFRLEIWEPLGPRSWRKRT